MATVKIRRIKDERLYPRDKVDYFKKNPKIWEELKWGKTIEIPAEIFTELKSVEIVKDAISKKEDKINKIDKGGDEG